MTANELRIGNRVLRYFWNPVPGNPPTEFLEACEIVLVKPETVNILIKGGIILSRIKIENLKPDPITPARLLSFGFENWGKKNISDTEYEISYVLHNAVDGTSDFKVIKTLSKFNDATLSMWSIRIDQDDIYVRHLDFIHQLQNVFHSLIGYDLTPDFSPSKA